MFSYRILGKISTKTLHKTFLSAGGKIKGIMLNDYSISQDGDTMALKVGVSSSIGYIRTIRAS